MISTTSFRIFSPTTLNRLVYVYLSVAQADGPLQPNERAVIVGKISSMERFPAGEIEALLEQAQKQMTSQTDHEIWVNVSNACHELCQSESDRQNLLKHLEDIIESDGRVKQQEMEMFRRISTIVA